MSLGSALQGSSLTARILRSAGFTVFGFGASQLIRLGSNLILTRLLFPEAFGMMALVMMILMGLAMFSDVGVSPAIMRSARGDDPDFLNTAWTIQVIRGFALWAVTLGLAYPMSLIYGAPELAWFLPVAGLTLILTGFNPTRLDTANRHLMLGRVTAIDIVTQVGAVIVGIALAWWLQSIWALVLSGLFSAAFQLVLYDRYLPGPRNRFRWEKPAAHELINFGKWVFLSTVAGFFFSQGDKMILGRWLSLDLFGVYNIGYFLAAFPMLLGGMVTRKILIPIYREKPPSESPGNFRKLRRMRCGVTALLLLLVCVFSALGVWMVDLLYDPRYQAAGAVVAVLAVMQIPQIVGLTYDQAALAAGDSRRFFVLAAARAGLMIAGLVIGVEWAGLLGGLLGQGAAMLVVYPVVVWLARRSGVWDPLHDAIFFAIGALGGGAALLSNRDAILALLAIS